MRTPAKPKVSKEHHTTEAGNSAPRRKKSSRSAILSALGDDKSDAVKNMKSMQTINKNTKCKKEVSDSMSNSKLRFNPNCKQCVKERREKEARQKKTQNQRRSRVHKSRVTKFKKRGSRCRLDGYHSKNTNKQNNIMQKFMSCCNNESVKPLNSRINLNGSTTEVIYTKNFDDSGKSENVSKSDVASDKYPDTSFPSLTSYNSFVSMDQEPME